MVVALIQLDSRTLVANPLKVRRQAKVLYSLGKVGFTAKSEGYNCGGKVLGKLTHDGDVLGFLYGLERGLCRDGTLVHPAVIQWHIFQEDVMVSWKSNLKDKK